MLRTLLLLITTIAMLAQTPERYNYPAARKAPQVDTYHGDKVADPYRWLEDPDSAESQTWIEAENKLTQSYLQAIPQREGIRKRLTELWNFERYPPQALQKFAGAFQTGGRYFVFKNDGLQNQDVLYVLDSLKDQGRVVIDPNALTKDGTAALTSVSVSPNGKLIAYSVAQSGSDWTEWRIREIDSGKDRADVIRWTKFSGAEWTPDSAGFYYVRFPEPEDKAALTAPNYFPKIYHHRLGSEQSADKLIYDRPDKKDWRFWPVITDDGRYLVMSVESGDFGKNMLFYQDLKAGKTVELIPVLEDIFDFLGNEGATFYFRTTSGARKGRVIAIDTTRPERKNWREVVPERPETIAGAVMADGKLVVSYLRDARSEAKVYSVAGKFLHDVKLPGIGSVEWSPARGNDTELFFSFVSYTTPTAVYRYDLKSGAVEPFRRSQVKFDPSLYETKQVFYKSKDGTRIPMFITSRKGLKQDGKNPTLLYGYGGFNVALTPAFSPAFLGWMEMGGIYAVANLRGGSEYGEEWHLAGTKDRKQNVFDDFIAAAEYLIAEHYTSTPKLAIFGGSNGGLLVGATLNQRPDLFGAAMPAVGVMDMLRFHKFTVGAGWVGDYGSPDKPEEYKALRAYSPVHNIRPGTKYPPVLITTADHDDRVVPGHSFKYAAAMQAAQEGNAPILIRIDTKAGHGAGKPTTKTIDEYADRWAFLVKSLGM
jgi:prolyl oligopeptidase